MSDHRAGKIADATDDDVLAEPSRDGTDPGSGVRSDLALALQTDGHRVVRLDGVAGWATGTTLARALRSTNRRLPSASYLPRNRVLLGQEGSGRAGPAPCSDVSQ